MDKPPLKGLGGAVDGNGFESLDGLKVSVDELVYQPQVLTAPEWCPIPGRSW
jgi:hypothetical protein